MVSIGLHFVSVLTFLLFSFRHISSCSSQRLTEVTVAVDAFEGYRSEVVSSPAT